MAIKFLYEDQWILAVDKPAGLLTIPSPRKEKRCLVEILNSLLKEKSVAYRLHPCHRLDRETSGVILFAKGKSAQGRMMELFRQKRIKKVYLALVHGLPHPEKGKITQCLAGQYASTNYRVLEKRKGYSIVEVSPDTGRKNQIRLHFKNIGCPLVGESRFAFRRDFSLKGKRAFLHAQRLEFIHPWINKLIVIKADLPKDITDFISRH